MRSMRPDVVDRVDNATLADLRGVDIDDVYKQMDWLLESRPTPIDLYHRWEGQNWSTQDLDFSEDKLHWQSLEGPFEGIRIELQRSFTLFFVGEQAVTDTLSPLVHGAPDEGSRIFLSTQLVDEARHTVFFSRFFSDVIGISGGLSEALAVLRDKTVGGFRQLFDEDLVDATEAVRKDPHDYGAWIEGITVYHLIVEGMLALTGQKFLLEHVARDADPPRFLRGVHGGGTRRVAPCELRGPGDHGSRDKGPRICWQRVEDTIKRLLPQACRIVAAPDRRFAIEPERDPRESPDQPLRRASVLVELLDETPAGSPGYPTRLARTSPAWASTITTRPGRSTRICTGSTTPAASTTRWRHRAPSGGSTSHPSRFATLNRP